LTTPGENIKRYRKAFGLSQHELARRSGLAQPNISAVENGRHYPQFETIRKLAIAFGLPMSALIDEAPTGPPPPPKTPRTDEDGASFDKRFGSTGPVEAEELREELASEVTELERFVKGLRAGGVGDETFTLRRARARLESAKTRLFAVQLRQGDLDQSAGREVRPKAAVAEYIPGAKDTEELLRMLRGEERGAKTG